MERYKREHFLFRPEAKEPFKLSRSKIDLFLECPRCFYLDRRMGYPRPSGPGFALNLAVDALLKKEFDLLRTDKKAHALMTKYGIDAVPFDHPDFPIWRDDVNKKEGATALHGETNLIVAGIIDDVWIDSQGQLHIVDYKSTSTIKEISLEDEYKQAYKRQMEIYQWIFREKGFNVSDIGYFVYANATKNRPKFDGRLEFDLSIISYKGNSSWLVPTLVKIRECLLADQSPERNPKCKYCQYTFSTSKFGK